MTQARVRRAGPGDAAELVRLRAVMLDAMGIATDEAWRVASEARIVPRLRATERFAAFVADSADGSALAACAVGWVQEFLTSDIGHLASVATDPSRRREGLATACTSATVAWLRATGVSRIDLNATPEAEPIYRALGFVEPTWRALTLQLRPR